MEALLIVFIGPFLIEILLTSLSLVVYGLLSVTFSLVDFTLSLLSFSGSKRFSKPKKRPSSVGASKKTRVKTGRTRKMLRVLSVCGVISFSVLLLVEFFFFDSAVRSVLRTAASRSGASISVGSIDGSIFRGRLRLTDLRLQRSHHQESNYDMQIESLSIDIDMQSMFSRSKSVENLTLSNVSGKFECLNRPAGANKRKQYTIRQLSASDIHLTISDHCVSDGSTQFALAVESFESRVLRSRLLVFDVLFNTDAKIKIDQSEIQFRYSGTPSSGTSTWEGRSLPISVFRHYLGRPMLLLTSGSLDFNARNEWNYAKSTTLRLKADWEMTLTDVRASTPQVFTAKERLVALPVAKFINSSPEVLPLTFSFTLEESGIEFVYSALTDSVAASLYDGLQTFKAKTLSKSKELILKEDGEKILEFKKTFPGVKFKKDPESSTNP